MACCGMQYSSSTPADDPLKLDECRRAGAAIKNLLQKDIKPRDIMTRPAFENAMVRTRGHSPFRISNYSNKRRRRQDRADATTCCSAAACLPSFALLTKAPSCGASFCVWRGRCW